MLNWTMQCTDQLKCLCIPLNLSTAICRNKQTTMALVRAPIPKTSVQPCQLVLGPWMNWRKVHSGLGCRCFRSSLHCNQEVKRTNQLLLDCVGHSTLVTTNVGIPWGREVRWWQRGIAISFCVVLLKLRCVLLIARIETIRRQTSRNDMETDIPVCANTKYGYLKSDRYLQWRMINSSIYCVIIGTRLTVWKCP